MKVLLAILILIAASVVTALLVVFQPEVEAVAQSRPITSVEVMRVAPEATQIRIYSQGTLLPRAETDLSAEVSGRVIEVSKHFRAGAFFKAGDSLLKIEPSDYAAARAARAAELATARLNLAQEMAQAEQAKADWEALGSDLAPGSLTLRLPHIAQAEAQLESAEAALAQAERNLERTHLRAPYDGRVLSVSADLGQFLSANPAMPVARIFATAVAEVRLPITQHDADFLALDAANPPPVSLYRKRKSGGPPDWTGRLVRMEGSIDPSTRLLYAVVELNVPLEGGQLPVADASQTEPPTTPRRGEFVEAVIEGQTVEEVFILPRYALRGSAAVYVASEQPTLQRRPVEVLRSQDNRVLVKSGLAPGDQVVVSPVAYFVENMPVQIVDQP